MNLSKNITGTLVNYFVHCKRQCYLFYNKICLEDDSELVKIGRAIHSANEEDEISVENIKIDKITDKYIIEKKKSDADLQAAKFQLLFYLLKLKQKGIEKIGKIEVLEKNKAGSKVNIVEFNEENEASILNLISELELFLEKNEIPKFEYNNKCKKCAYSSYCRL